MYLNNLFNDYFRSKITATYCNFLLQNSTVIISSQNASFDYQKHLIKTILHFTYPNLSFLSILSGVPNFIRQIEDPCPRFF